ncbi:hypothetical protein SteCoe_1132 [Stentor coeruleus]|uniref:Casein kinase I n=1 Tax=Stentor coeruleus TaxID=5963 RepID=A0A1R2D2N5_9CILI|nr:hypothetical protein SteCoe_1132 [Stentor coeruleus]
MDELLANRYQIQKLIGKGSFGSVYAAIDSKTKKKLAIKVESVSITPSPIEKEILVLKKLNGLKGFPKLYSYGTYQEHNYMVMQRLGKNLSQVFKDFSHHFTIAEVTHIGCQMVKRIENLHSMEILHRDIKPSQFLVEGKILYLVDFGSCKSFIYAGSFHIPMTEDIGFIGTHMFASRNAHSKIQLSRRDDLESMCYSLAYLLRGNLPWIDPDSSKNTEAKIGFRKMNYSTLSIFEGFPEEFSQVLTYVKGLNFYYCPDYNFIFNIFINLLEKYENYNIRLFKNPKKPCKTCLIKSHKHTDTKKRHEKDTKKAENCLCLTEESSSLPEFKNRQQVPNNIKVYNSEILLEKQYTIEVKTQKCISEMIKDQKKGCKIF